jgi:hypothetical protein
MNFLLIFLSLLLLRQLSLRRSNNFKNKQKGDIKRTLETCTIPHVPTYLHWDGSTIVDKFFHDEKLYWRVSKTDISPKPFSSITLAEVSFNRSGNADLFFCNEKDALLNTTNNDEEFHSNCEVIELSIQKQDFDKNTVKTFTEPQDIKEGEKLYTVEMHLVHDPLICNNAHSMFRFKFEGEFVKFKEYKNSFGKDTPKAIKKLRSICKDELFKMQVRRIVDFD